MTASFLVFISLAIVLFSMYTFRMTNYIQNVIKVSKGNFRKSIFEFLKLKKKDELKKWYLMLITPFQR